MKLLFLSAACLGLGLSFTPSLNSAPLGQGSGSKTPTYAKDVAPVLHKRCANCHRPGEVAPFSLLTYADAKRWAPMIAAVVKEGSMPPWKAEPGHGDFVNPRILAPAEKAAILDWAKNGAPSGDLTKAPKPPKFADGWKLGEPDVVLEVPQTFDLYGEGPDILRNFVIPTSLGKDYMVGAVEFRPGNPKIVHHALVFLDNKGEARKLDERDPGPGYSSFGGPGFFPSGSLGGWAPGGQPEWLPDGVGRYFANNSDVVVQVHYHPSGKPEKDRSKIGIYFVRKPATKFVGGIALENWDIQIPAGERGYHRSASYTLPLGATFLSITPHMHLLGKEMKVRAILPDGSKKSLAWIKNWDFDWQDTLIYKQPIELPAGTRLEMEAWFDNSSDNPLNPHSPPKKVTYGEESTDEMALCIFEITTNKIEELLYLIQDDSRHRKVVERAIEAYQKKKIGG